MMAKRQIEDADVALLVVDAAQGVTTGDLAIAGTAWELGKPCVVVVNKWDLLDEESRAALEDSWERLDEVLAVPSRVNVSALTARGIDKIFPAVEETLQRFDLALGTSELNRILERLHEVVAPGGSIIGDTLDPYQTDDADHLAYHEHNRAKGRMGGQIRMRVRYKAYKSPWFDYLFLSRKELEEVLDGTGWRLREIIGGYSGPSYAVHIDRLGHG